LRILFTITIWATSIAKTMLMSVGFVVALGISVIILLVERMIGFGVLLNNTIRILSNNTLALSLGNQPS